MSKCPACRKDVEPGATRCPACKAPIKISSPDERAALLRRTGDFVSIDGVQDAIETYLKRWPNAPECRDVRLANQCLLLQLMLVQMALHRKFSGRGSADVELLGALCADGLPPRLANGLLASARVKDPDRRARTVDWITRAANVCAVGILRPHYDAAAQERLDLLVDGRAKYEVKKVDRETCMRDFKVHFASFERGDLAAACEGMQHLKQLNPDEPLFRWGLGTVLLRNGKHLVALQEALYGFSLAPDDSGHAALLLQCLCTLALYPAAVEVARHHENLRANHVAQAAEMNDAMARTARGFTVLARAVTTASAAVAVECGSNDCSNDVPEVVDDMALVARPWLTEPPEAKPVANPMSTARVFISYRHRGGRNFAQRIEGALKAAYPSMHVFRDETWLEAGDDFVETLGHEIDTADALIALVDDDWARRFVDPTDVLHREVARAIEHDRRIIPVLLEDAPMPAEQVLPPDIASFARLHARRLTHARFDEEMLALGAR